MLCSILKTIGLVLGSRVQGYSTCLAYSNSHLLLSSCIRSVLAFFFSFSFSRGVLHRATSDSVLRFQEPSRTLRIDPGLAVFKTSILSPVLLLLSHVFHLLLLLTSIMIVWFLGQMLPKTNLAWEKFPKISIYVTVRVGSGIIRHLVNLTSHLESYFSSSSLVHYGIIMWYSKLNLVHYDITFYLVFQIKSMPTVIAGALNFSFFPSRSLSQFGLLVFWDLLE